MQQPLTPSIRERAVSVTAVFALHAALGLLLVRGGVEQARAPDQPALSTFDIAQPPPPQADVRPDSAADPREEGAAAPAAREAVATPVVAPPVRLPRPSPVIAAPVAGEGSDTSAGAAPVPGPGSGGGGAGEGTGSGRGGDGQGGGGGGIRAAKVAGAIVERDYPRAARRAREQGSVTVRFTVGTDGRARDCVVARSSGSDALDDITCRLVEQRFRYRPARDRAGAPIEEARGWRQDWWLERDGGN